MVALESVAAQRERSACHWGWLLCRGRCRVRGRQRRAYMAQHRDSGCPLGGPDSRIARRAARTPSPPEQLRDLLEERHPLRYREVNVPSERDRPRLRLLGAVLLTAVCLYTAFVVVRALVFAAEGARDRWQAWLVLVAIGWTGLWAGIFALRKWRRLAAARRSDSN
jgi:hypothetical protein